MRPTSLVVLVVSCLGASMSVANAQEAPATPAVTVSEPPPVQPASPTAFKNVRNASLTYNGANVYSKDASQLLSPKRLKGWTKLNVWVNFTTGVVDLQGYLANGQTDKRIEGKLEPAEVQSLLSILGQVEAGDQKLEDALYEQMGNFIDGSTDWGVTDEFVRVTAVVPGHGVYEGTANLPSEYMAESYEELTQTYGVPPSLGTSIGIYKALGDALATIGKRLLDADETPAPVTAPAAPATPEPAKGKGVDAVLGSIAGASHATESEKAKASPAAPKAAANQPKAAAPIADKPLGE